jgi:hypothetical protein
MIDDIPKLTPEQSAHSADVRAALPTTGDGHGRWTILVYCDAESHEKPRNVGEFRIVTALHDEWLSFWTYHPRGRDHKRRLMRRIRRGVDTVANTNHQNLVDDRLMRKPSAGDVADRRYPLRCGACGDSLPWRRASVRREDALELALDKLAINGVSEISLGGLRRIVAS